MSDKGAGSAKLRFDSPLQELYLNLWRTYDRLRELEDALFAQYGLNSLQYNVLRLLKAAQPGAMATLAIAERLVSRAPDITRLLDRLEKRGLIERVRTEEDRRQVLARIKPAGIELLHTIAQPLEKCHERQLGHLSAAQTKKLIELLQAARHPHELPGSSWS
ncbi:MAG: MarR family winged helix-turn-helix transcriptional regulator [Aureliella sp.]|jgi:DNA-binding MarR family transcriptional regulator